MPKRKNPPKGWHSADVKWHVDERKTPIAYSTKAASDLILALAQENETVQDVYNAIRYDAEAKKVLQAYIDKGYGNKIARMLWG